MPDGMYPGDTMTDVQRGRALRRYGGRRGLRQYFNYKRQEYDSGEGGKYSVPKPVNIYRSTKYSGNERRLNPGDTG